MDAISGLTAYFDDSGTHDDGSQGPSSHIVVGGYLGTSAQWELFSEEWKDILARYDLKGQHFHMANFINGRKPFDHLPYERRDSLLYQLLCLIRARSIIGVTSAVPRTDFEEAIGAETDRYGHPYNLTATSALSLVKIWQKYNGNSMPVAFVVEDGTKHKDEISDGFEKSKRQGDIEGRLENDSLRFCPKSVVPLQAADLIAWYARRSLLQNDPWRPTGYQGWRHLMKSHLEQHRHIDAPWGTSHLVQAKETYEQRLAELNART